MPRTTLALSSFVSGEFSAKLDGRTDFDKYNSGVKTMENFLVHPQGAATRRVGTQHIAEVKDSSKKTRLIPFEFSTTQTYILEFGDQYMRVYKDKGQVLSGGSAFEISTPYLEAELFDIKFAQSADVLYLCHPNHDVRKLSRTGHTSWTLATVSFSGSPSLPISGSDNRPSCVSFFEQRLVFANTNNNPQTLWFSKSGDYENFTTGTNADDAMIYTIASNQVNAIQYLKAVRTLIVGTSGGEFTVSADGTDAAITPTNVTIKRQSSFGSAKVDAIPAGNAVLFLQKAKRKIRELAYNFDSDGYVAPDLTILNDTVTKTGINQMAFQQEPDSIIWCVREDGVLAGMTYQRSENVVAWHRHIFGGAFGNGNAVCESVASISGTLTEDEVWVIVKRTINGATKRYVECFSDFDFDETSATDFKFLDSHLSYSGSSTTTLSGLAHLEGQSVSILADGSVHANKTVSSGAITLDRAVTKACVGLSYDSVLQTMRIEGGAAEGTSQGKTKRISKVVLRLFETVGVKVGPSLSQLETVPFRTTSSNLSAPVDTLLAGDKEIEFRDDYNSDGFIFIKQDQPLPCSILAIYPTLVTSDG
ncbi:putative tail tubular B [Pelagibacter phage HTVC028P]|nr:putative tail tubular B [Pelagibacter phage HTVC028P]